MTAGDPQKGLGLMGMSSHFWVDLKSPMKKRCKPKGRIGFAEKCSATQSHFSKSTTAVSQEKKQKWVPHTGFPIKRSGPQQNGTLNTKARRAGLST